MSLASSKRGATLRAAVEPGQRGQARSRAATSRRRTAPTTIWTVVVGAVIVGVWQASGSFANPIFVSTPGAILESIPQTFFHGPQGALSSALGATMLDVLYGFGASIVVGICAGYLIGSSTVLRRLLDPIVGLGNSSPTIALLPLLIVWFGFGITSRVLFIFVVSVWAIVINTSVGARIAHERYLDLKVAFSVRPRRYLARVVVPGALPYVLTGLRIATAHAIIAAIISGSELGLNGIGGLAQQYGSQFLTADLLGVVVLTTVIALILYKAIEVARNRFCSWVNYE
jgi:NitT/TauT family transport system permease protein